MRLLLLIALFVFIPYDAQLWAIGLVRSLPIEVWMGVAAGVMVCMFAYAAGWNGLASQLHSEDVNRAEESYRKRRR